MVSGLYECLRGLVPWVIGVIADEVLIGSHCRSLGGCAHNDRSILYKRHPRRVIYLILLLSLGGMTN